MRQIIGLRDFTKIGKCKVVIAEATLDAMQPNTQQQQQQPDILFKSKRIRSAFTTDQINQLEKQYKKFPYITGEQRKEVANVLKIDERSVKIWFQNRRMKEKKESYKEFNDETNNNLKGKDQLNNVPALPSTNDQCSYSLPILSSTADTITNTDNMKANKVECKEKGNKKPENHKNNNFEPKTSYLKAHSYKEACNQEYLSEYFHHIPPSNTTSPSTIDVKNKRQPSQECNTSAELSINLCKKYKKECTATNTARFGNTATEGQKKFETMQPPKKNSKYYYSHRKDFRVKTKKPMYPTSSKQVKLNDPAYYPVMPSVYASPFMSSGGVVWKPVNFMPVMATNVPPQPISNHQGSSAHEQDKNCKCNCHGSTQHVQLTLPPSIQNQYAQYGQYVITVPFPQTSPKY